MLRRVEIELDEADDIVCRYFLPAVSALTLVAPQISQLEIEVQGIPVSVRSPYNARLKQAKYDLNRYKKLSKDLHSQSSRADLLGSPRFKAGATSDDPYGERSDRTRLLAGTQTLSDGNRRIADSTRIALETEEQGADILRSLRVQGEQIQNSRNTVCSNLAPLLFFEPTLLL